jgi:hypothetical protein
MWLNLELKCVDVDGVEPVMVKEASCTEARGGTCEKVAGKRLRRPVWGLFSAPFRAKRPLPDVRSVPYLCLVGHDLLANTVVTSICCHR